MATKKTTTPRLKVTWFRAECEEVNTVIADRIDRIYDMYEKKSYYRVSIKDSNLSSFLIDINNLLFVGVDYE